MYLLKSSLLPFLQITLGSLVMPNYSTCPPFMHSNCAQHTSIANNETPRGRPPYSKSTDVIVYLRSIFFSILVVGRILLSFSFIKFDIEIEEKNRHFVFISFWYFFFFLLSFLFVWSGNGNCEKSLID